MGYIVVLVIFFLVVHTFYYFIFTNIFSYIESGEEISIIATWATVFIFAVYGFVGSIKNKKIYGGQLLLTKGREVGEIRLSYSIAVHEEGLLIDQFYIPFKSIESINVYKGVRTGGIFLGIPVIEDELVINMKDGTRRRFIGNSAEKKYQKIRKIFNSYQRFNKNI